MSANDPLDRRDLAFALACFAIATASVCVVFFGAFAFSPSYEFSSYADAARTLLSEGRLATHFAEPFDIASFERDGIDLAPPWPLSQRFPLLAVVLALAFLVAGASDAVAAAVHAVLWGALVASTYAVARVTLHHRRAALGAALLLGATPLFWANLALFGFPDFLFAVLFLPWSMLLARGPRGDSAPFAVGVALLSAVLYLARPNMIAFTPIALVLLSDADGRRRWRAVAIYLAVYVPLVGGAWWLRQATAGSVQSSTLLTNLANTGDTLSWYDYRTLTWHEVLDGKLGAIARKTGSTLLHELAWLLAPFGWLWTLPAAALVLLVDVVRGGAERRWRRLVVLTGACLLVQLALFAPLRFEWSGRYFVWLAPVLACIGVRAVLVAVERLQHGALVVALFALVAGGSLVRQVQTLPAAPFLLHGLEPSPLEVELPALREVLDPREIVMSNVGVHLAWYLEQPAVDLPNTPEDALRLARRLGVRHVFLVRWGQGELFNRPAWVALLRHADWQDELRRAWPIRSIAELRGTVVIELDVGAPEAGAASGL